MHSPSYFPPFSFILLWWISDGVVFLLSSQDFWLISSLFLHFVCLIVKNKYSSYVFRDLFFQIVVLVYSLFFFGMAWIVCITLLQIKKHTRDRWPSAMMGKKEVNQKVGNLCTIWKLSYISDFSSFYKSFKKLSLNSNATRSGIFVGKEFKLWYRVVEFTSTKNQVKFEQSPDVQL